MFEIIYRVALAPEKLVIYMNAWKATAQYMLQFQGAVSSSFYSSTDEAECLIHSRWPNRLMHSRSWPLSGSDPASVHEASAVMAASRTSLERIEGYSSKEASDYISRTAFALREKVESAKKQILIYNDAGCGTSTYEILDILRKTVDLSTIRILVVDADYVKSIPDWESKTCLFIIPGGRARPYYTALGSVWESDVVAKGEFRKLKEIGVGNVRIKEFVESGGSYLGICAGAYYGATTVFEKGGVYEVLDESALGFFPGIAEGPAYGLGRFEYASEQGAEVAELESDRLVSGRMTSYFNGGSFFTNPDGTSEVEASKVLAHYSNIVARGVGDTHHEVAAIVENRVGKGLAILSGVHVEYSSDSPDDLTAAVRASLAHDDAPRKLFVAELLDRLGVPVREYLLTQLYAAPTAKLELAALEGFSNKFARKRFTIIDSTQTYAKNNIDEVEENIWRLVTADQQEKGVGTHGRVWLSPVGNIYATFSIMLPADFNPIGASHVAGLSILQVLKTYGLDPKFKWVNDVLLNNKKVSGVLCEITSNSRGQRVLHIGIGLNIDLSAKECENLSQPATSLLLELRKRVDKEEILSKLQQVLAYNFFLFFKHGYPFFVGEINKHIAFRGEEVIFDTEDKTETVIFPGTLEGITEEGGLLLRTKEGRLRAYYTGRILRGKELLTATRGMAMSRADKPVVGVEAAAAAVPIPAAVAAPAAGGAGGGAAAGAGAAAAGTSFLGRPDVFFPRIHFDLIPSTQKYLLENLDTVFADKDRIAVTAAEQGAGIGTIDPTTGVARVYVSLRNDLYVTFGVILPAERADEMSAEHPLVTQIAALAAIRALGEFEIAANIKWRNDLRVGGKKLGGLLCEVKPLADGRRAGLIGIGVNVNRTQENCDLVTDQKITSMMLASGKTFSVEDVYRVLAKHISGFMKLYFEHGMSYFSDDVKASLEGVGRTVRVICQDVIKDEALEGEYLGIDATGCLQLKLADATIRSIKKGRIDKESLEAPVSAHGMGHGGGAS